MNANQTRAQIAAEGSQSGADIALTQEDALIRANHYGRASLYSRTFGTMVSGDKRDASHFRRAAFPGLQDYAERGSRLRHEMLAFGYYAP